MAEFERDADTGDEIIHFVRRGRHYLYLRDRLTKILIRRLRSVELRLFMVVDYSEKQAKKGNPLYVDAGIFSQLNPVSFSLRKSIEKSLEKKLRERLEDMFGKSVAKELLELAGVEYGSKPYYPETIEQALAHYLVVWKHRKRETPKKLEASLRV
jgi:hypothetical protein